MLKRDNKRQIGDSECVVFTMIFSSDHHLPFVPILTLIKGSRQQTEILEFPKKFSVQAEKRDQAS